MQDFTRARKVTSLGWFGEDQVKTQGSGQINGGHGADDCQGEEKNELTSSFPRLILCFEKIHGLREKAIPPVWQSSWRGHLLEGNLGRFLLGSILDFKESSLLEVGESSDQGIGKGFPLGIVGHNGIVIGLPGESDFIFC